MWDKTLWGRLRVLKIISKENIFQKQGEFKSNVEAWLFKTATGNRQDNTAVTEINVGLTQEWLHTTKADSQMLAK